MHTLHHHMKMESGQESGTHTSHEGL